MHGACIFRLARLGDLQIIDPSILPPVLPFQAAGRLFALVGAAAAAVALAGELEMAAVFAAKVSAGLVVAGHA